MRCELRRSYLSTCSVEYSQTTERTPGNAGQRKAKSAEYMQEREAEKGDERVVWRTKGGLKGLVMGTRGVRVIASAARPEPQSSARANTGNPLKYTLDPDAFQIFPSLLYYIHIP